MKVKQIYAALDIGSYEIKLILGEFYNSRFNIIRVECVKCDGVVNYQIVDSLAVSKAIMEALKNISDLLSIRIESVLLAIPPYKLKRHSERIEVPILSDDHHIKLTDIQNAIKLVQRKAYGDDEICVNVAPVKYYLDSGIGTRRLPLNEVCSNMSVDIDIYTVSKKLVYAYVSAVEKSGLKILDIYVEPFAEAKEAAIFEQSVEQYVVYANIGYQMTSLTIFYKGRLSENICLKMGTKQLDEAIMKRFNLQREVASRLKKYNTHLLEENVRDEVIYIWSNNNINNTMTEKQLYDTIKSVIDGWLDEINDVCSQLFAQKNVKMVFGGGGGEIFEFDKYATRVLNVECSTYIPDTMGARTSSLIATLGLFYAFKDTCEYTKNENTSVNTEAFANSILPSKIGEEGFTGRIRGLLFNENKDRNKE